MIKNRATGPVLDSRAADDAEMAYVSQHDEDIRTPEPRTLTPNLPPHILIRLGAFIEIKRTDGRDVLAGSLRRLHDLWQDEVWSLELRAIALILADLIDQGWEVTSDDRAIHLQPPGLRLVGETAEQAKDRLRRALLIGRDRGPRLSRSPFPGCLLQPLANRKAWPYFCLTTHLPGVHATHATWNAKKP